MTKSSSVAQCFSKAQVKLPKVKKVQESINIGKLFHKKTTRSGGFKI